jgi:hypothetical protein
MLLFLPFGLWSLLHGDVEFCCPGVMFWVSGVYALFYLKCNLDVFLNVKQFQIKNPCVQLHVLHMHKVVS